MQKPSRYAAIILCPPREFPKFKDQLLPLPFEPTEKYVERVNEYGDPNNRYRSFSVALNYKDLNKLDALCFMLRRVSFPLNITVTDNAEIARDLLLKDRALQLHPTMAFEKGSGDAERQFINDAFEWRNFAYFYTDAIEKRKICTGMKASNSAIYLALSEASGNYTTLKWIAKFALHGNLRKEMAMAIKSRQAP